MLLGIVLRTQERDHLSRKVVMDIFSEWLILPGMTKDFLRGHACLCW
jgi:hypothetical protein